MLEIAKSQFQDPTATLHEILTEKSLKEINKLIAFYQLILYDHICLFIKLNQGLFWYFPGLGGWVVIIKIKASIVKFL